ncbi:PqqD family protein [Streptomyces sp. NPDC049555]|uniref:PqqD family protein n=1 Tax=Streptomyces sp. NPDC049555 TaxID=3154930 RepID=UPI003448D196
MLIPARHIHYATGPHGTAILDIRRAAWLMLDADASHIWHALTTRSDAAGLADEIAAPTGHDPRELRTQITAFINELVDAGVLEDTDRPRRRRRWWRR